MISYELAKQLKEAGFPQIERLHNDLSEKDFVTYPTLEELVEACGADFSSLTLEADGGWSCFDRKASDLFEGSTPTEAIARLWLALNKKTPN